jgi:hypothetical protein
MVGTVFAWNILCRATLSCSPNLRAACASSIWHDRCALLVSHESVA